MSVNKSEELSDLVEILNEVKGCSNDPDRIDYIVNYLHNLTSILFKYEDIIKRLSNNQELAVKFHTTSNDAMEKIISRLDVLEQHLEIHDKHLDAHGQNLDIHSKHLDSHDNYLELLSKQSGI